jgi:tRNA A37 threonylcarbamoyladenosine dehydratase
MNDRGDIDPAFARIERLLGAEGLARLAEATAVVVGLGAVGSYAVEALARGGLGHLRLVDFDVVHPSNINRQLHALHSTIGLAKADLAAARAIDINPGCHVEPMATFAHVETFDRILRQPCHIVIDAIDSMTPKVQLLAACVRRDLPVISCLGAALRTDPEKIHLTPLAQTRNCPLARQVRKALRVEGIQGRFPCVWSEETVSHLPDQAVSEPEGGQPGPHQRGRPRRVLGSLPTIPGIFGLIAANKALEMLTGDAWPRAAVR